MVRAIAGIYFQSEVEITVKSITTEQFGLKFQREHVVYNINVYTEVDNDSLVPPTFVAQTRRHSEKQILKEVSVWCSIVGNVQAEI